MYIMHNFTDFFKNKSYFFLYKIDDYSLLGFRINVIVTTYGFIH